MCAHAPTMAAPFATERYLGDARQEAHPMEGNHVMASYDDEGVVLYQAFNPAIGAYAAEHRRFDGAPGYKDRMTWVKPGFLWMMFRSGWAHKPNQGCILRIRVTRAFFDEMLRGEWATHTVHAGRARRQLVCRARVPSRLSDAKLSPLAGHPAHAHGTRAPQQSVEGRDPAQATYVGSGTQTTGL